jgi:hypothetical protein
MPKTVPCPICRTDVKLPRDAEPGDELTCPNCDEVFVPPQLRRKEGYDPRDEETYEVGGTTRDVDRAKKKQKARALLRHGRRENEELWRNRAPGVIGGLEILLLIFAAVSAVALVIGYVLAQRAPKAGEAILIILGYCGLVGLFAWRKLVAK